MTDTNHYDFYDEKALNKFSLETYAVQLSNPFEPVFDKLIDGHIDKIKKLKESYVELEKRIAKPRKQDDTHELLVELSDVIQERTWLIDEIIALAEMKIIYAYKFLETNLKRVLRASMGVEHTKELNRWDAIKSFLKTKNIVIENLKGYKEVNQLREVNNAIKHSDEYTERLKGIPEFAASKNFTFNALNKFYIRVKDAPSDFLHALCLAISSELYDFDHNKLENIAQDIALRMDKKDAELLIERIREKYV